MSGTAAERAKVDLIGVVGPNGSGKTWLGLAVADARHDRQLRVRINSLDPTLAKGAQVIRDMDSLERALAVPKPVKICWDGSETYGEETGFKIAASLALRTGNICLFADEMHRYSGNKHKPMPPHLDNLLSRNFHARVSFIWTSTRPVELAPAFRTQSKQIALFYSPDRTDKDYARGMVGPELVKKLETEQHKAPYSCIIRNRNKPAQIMPPWPHSKWKGAFD